MEQFTIKLDVEAKKMTRGDFNSTMGWELLDNESETEEGYLVVGGNFLFKHSSQAAWMPKEEFESFILLSSSKNEDDTEEYRIT